MYGGQNATQASLRAAQILAATGFISPNAAITNNPYLLPTRTAIISSPLAGTLSEERQVLVAAYTVMTHHFHPVAVGDQ